MTAILINAYITPLCPSCGDELHGVTTEYRPTGDPLRRDNPTELVARRVFIQPCKKCFTHMSYATELIEAAKLVAELGTDRVDNAGRKLASALALFEE